jgi:hypothetical protein
VYFHDLESDEAVYAQAAFAVSKGYVPYKDIFFASPPIYLYIESVVVALNPSLWSIRAFNVFLGLVTIILIFLLSREIYASERLTLIASALYALYPFVVYMNKLALIDNGLTFLVALVFLLFAKYYYKSSNLRYLVASGILAGLASLTKYTALYFILVLMILLIFRKKFHHFIIFVACMLVSPLITFVTLILSNTWLYFYQQTILWQVIRFNETWFEKLWVFSSYFGTVFPLFLLLIPAVTNFDKDLLIILWYFVPMIIILFGKTLFLQYFIALTPPLCILAAKTINRFIPSSFTIRQRINFKCILGSRIIRQRIFGSFAILIILLNLAFLVSQVYGGNWLMLDAPFTNPAMEKALKAKMAAASYIDNITSPRDVIWTSDASLAFLAHRMIVEPNSTIWKFQGFFEDVWGYSGSQFRGTFEGYPQGLISLYDILHAWEKYKPKVIVIIRTSWVDYYIWYGIHNSRTNQTGLSNYILANYELGPEINGVGSTFYPQNIEIWVRKET